MSEYLIAKCFDNSKRKNITALMPDASTGDERIYIRVTSDEKQKIKEKANQVGINTSRYIRNICLEKDIIVIENLKEFARELNKIGNNLNQIARLCNEGLIQCADIRETQETLKEIYSELVKLKKTTRLGR